MFLVTVDLASIFHMPQTPHVFDFHHQTIIFSMIAILDYQMMVSYDMAVALLHLV
ncbi:hypothetical protein [Candidatus Nitrosocosmicus sp. SS]|uniref:hypothetical protein n=1 Tax=Candidatus Nitrosocosmicus agrestis TaxID=2563600 RepID=UPI001331439F|nr:hypothetical protein [Candidatus Nitrosocosmicus sp. SS]